jgi:hypothetical protein
MSCGEYTSCGDPCGIPGLRYIDQDLHPTGKNPRTIAVNDWLYSLVLNILNTRAREPGVKCGVSTTNVGGHWSESYREDGLYNGTMIWTRRHKTYSSIQEAIRLLKVQLQSDMGKLIKMKVASSVEVTVTYKGKNKVEATIVIISPIADENILTLTSERISSDWVWR